MITIDDAQDMLDEIAEELPHEFFRDLNGGILLLPEKKISPHSVNDDLFIMGQYYVGSSMGRMIYIYFGSFEALYGHASPTKFKSKLREVLLHEFTHHLESLAGDRSLEQKDEQDLAYYQRKK